MKMKKLTACDIENLSKLPEDKWFEGFETWPQVKRTAYSLGRLVDAGYVETKIVGEIMHTRLYRKIKLIP